MTSQIPYVQVHFLCEAKCTVEYVIGSRSCVLTKTTVGLDFPLAWNVVAVDRFSVRGKGNAFVESFSPKRVVETKFEKRGGIGNATGRPIEEAGGALGPLKWISRVGGGKDREWARL